VREPCEKNVIMATIKLFYDTRKPKKDGTSPLRLKLFHQNKARYIFLNLCFKPNQWITEDGKVKSAFPNSTRVNASIRKHLSDASLILLENEQIIDDLDIDELQRLITLRLFGENKTIKRKEYFFVFTDGIIEDLIKAKRIGTATSYRTTLNSFKNFLDEKDLLLIKIDHKFLTDYQTYCLNKGMKINAIGVYLRTLRAIINRAIDEGILLHTKYPFRKFSIKSEKTEKRAITKEQIKKVLDVKLKKDTSLWHSKNYFSFMFNMRGMNFIDLSYLTMENIRDNRLIYRRIKTGKLYNIKLTTQAKEIVSHYTKGKKLNSKEYIFPIMPDKIDDAEKERERYIDKRKYFNQDLKEIAKKCKIDVNLTSYVSRHTWASLAKFAGVSHAIIGESLGHSDLKTTETYLANFGNDTLDDANDLIVG
jgi:integrase/recombinase XerD